MAEAVTFKTPNVNVTGAARLHRAASVLMDGLGLMAAKQIVNR